MTRIGRIASLVIWLAFPLHVSAQSCLGNYEACPSDTTVSSLVKKWAALDDRDMKWEASWDFPINDYERFNVLGRFDRVETFGQALVHLNEVIQSQVVPAPIPYATCVFRDVVVIRENGC